MRKFLSLVLQQIGAIVQKKSPQVIYITLAYVLLLILVKWRFSFRLEAVYFASGSALGLYFLDAANSFWKQTYSPFRTVLFCVGLLLVGLFVVTSSASQFSCGLVLITYLTILVEQYNEIRKTACLESWFRVVTVPVPALVQKQLYFVSVGMFIVLSLLYLRA